MMGCDEGHLQTLSCHQGGTTISQDDSRPEPVDTSGCDTSEVDIGLLVNFLVYIKKIGYHESQMSLDNFIFLPSKKKTSV